MKLKRLYYLLFVLFLVVFVSACKTTGKFEPKNAEEAFKEGLNLFEDKEYAEALSYFDMIKLQFPGSGIADKAQYYTAEINFVRKEFILASFNYNRVRTVYPGSEFAKISLYKAGLSQYLMSSDYHKDQEYTLKAIKTLQDYQFYYSEKDSLYNETEKMILECRNKLGEKDFMIAELYKTLESPRSALIYYESVLKNYDDTKYYEPSIFGKIEMLYWMKKTDEAKNAELTYKSIFPNGKYFQQIEEVKTKYTNK
jgi:outer membrane protein assembly factor BamD